MLDIEKSQIKSLEEKGLAEFLDSYVILTETARKITKNFEFSPLPVLRICQMLNECKDRTIHITGMGRSGKVGMIFGNLLKNQGYRVSLIGKTYARPVREGDLMIAFSGSGWTRTTALNVEDSLKNKAVTAAFTSSLNSKIARLSDHIIPIVTSDEDPEKKKVTSYDRRQLQGKKAPLTPLGTIFELTSMFVTFGVTSALVHESPLFGFVSGSSRIMESAERTLASLISKTDNLKAVITLLEECSSDNNDDPPKVYCVGSGISNIIASISGMRLQHLRLNIQSIYDWRFRNKGDVIIAVSGSGETSQTLNYMKQAKESGMKVISLTSSEESTMAKESDYCLVIHGREREGRSTYVEQEPFDPVSRTGYHDPSFEYCAAVTLDAIVAQLATDLGITEESMKKEHANIE